MEDESIDVEKLMRQVRDKNESKRPGRPKPGEYAIKPPEQPAPDGIQADHDYLHENWDVTRIDYDIQSHRMLAGPVIVKGRQLINGEVRRYVDPMFARQTWFNAGLLRYMESSLRQADGRMSALGYQIERRLSDMDGSILDYNARSDAAMEKAISDSEKKIGKLRSDINSMRSEVADLVSAEVHSTIVAIDDDLDKKAWLAAIMEERAGVDSGGYPGADGVSADLDYLNFENNFRGSMEEISRRQADFIEYYRERSRVLDIGCGRGEFLDLMRENGIGAHGIDIDDGMVRYCEARGLDAKKADALEYLSGLGDGSLDGIFCDQVAEHLEPGYLVRMLRLCHQKMQDSSPILIETVNPTSFTSFANFYIDLTHRHPLHPQTLSYLIRAVGFQDVRVCFVSPVQDRLKKINVDLTMTEKERDAFTIYNDNMDRLNNILFGAQDYYVVGRKGLR